MPASDDDIDSRTRPSSSGDSRISIRPSVACRTASPNCVAIGRMASRPVGTVSALRTSELDAWSTRLSATGPSPTRARPGSSRSTRQLRHFYDIRGFPNRFGLNRIPSRTQQGGGLSVLRWPISPPGLLRFWLLHPRPNNLNRHLRGSCGQLRLPPVDWKSLVADWLVQAPSRRPPGRPEAGAAADCGAGVTCSAISLNPVSRAGRFGQVPTGRPRHSQRSPTRPPSPGAKRLGPGHPPRTSPSDVLRASTELKSECRLPRPNQSLQWRVDRHLLHPGVECTLGAVASVGAEAHLGVTRGIAFVVRVSPRPRPPHQVFTRQATGPIHRYQLFCLQVPLGGYIHRWFCAGTALSRRAFVRVQRRNLRASALAQLLWGAVDHSHVQWPCYPPLLFQAVYRDLGMGGRQRHVPYSGYRNLYRLARTPIKYLPIQLRRHLPKVASRMVFSRNLIGDSFAQSRALGALILVNPHGHRDANIRLAQFRLIRKCVQRRPQPAPQRAVSPSHHEWLYLEPPRSTPCLPVRL